jgi:predicted alpha/beta-fold hydrolase
MPIIASEYKSPWWAKNQQVATIWPAKFRIKQRLKTQRERFELNDGDFIDVDFKEQGNNKAVILFHGLEGNAHRTYMRNMAVLFYKNNWDVFLVNHRSCSGEDNRLFSCYHSGKSDDLHEIFDLLQKKHPQKQWGLIGFSLGANMILKYSGNSGFSKPNSLLGSVCISPPVDLGACNIALHQRKNWIYHQTFFRTMFKKLKLKLRKFPEKDTGQLKRIKTLFDFDEEYTGPAHGFGNAQGYYDTCSSFEDFSTIDLPTYVLMAQNDSFLLPECFPKEFAQNNKNIFLEIPQHGGHVGFAQNNKVYYSERKALEFLESLV